MPNNNKRVIEAKNSNLSARTITIVAIATAIISILLLVYAPQALEVIASFTGCLLLVAMAVCPMINLAIESYEKH
jgi:uncharacterized membrane protein